MIRLALVTAMLWASPLAAQEGAEMGDAVEGRADTLYTLLLQPQVENPAVAQARAAFASGGARACEGAEARIVLLEPDADGARTAYLVSRAQRAETVFTGGHYRTRLDANLATGAVEELGSGCETLSWDGADPDLEMRIAYLKRPGAAGPTEIDLLISRQVPFAIGLLAPPTVWPLLGGRADEPLDADPAMLAGE